MEEEKKILDRISEILKDENKAKALEAVLDVANIEDVKTLKEVLYDYREINKKENGVSLQDKVNYVIESRVFGQFYELLQSEDKRNALQLILNDLMNAQIIQKYKKLKNTIIFYMELMARRIVSKNLMKQLSILKTVKLRLKNWLKAFEILVKI